MYVDFVQGYGIIGVQLVLKVICPCGGVARMDVVLIVHEKYALEGCL